MGAEANGVGAGHHGRLVEYYERSWLDYRMLWLDSSTRALHFGYEQPGERRHAASLLALNHVMAESVGLRSGERVLDAGCGVGGTSMWLAETYDCDVVGVNLVEDHVARAERYARERNLMTQVRFEVSDFGATNLPAADRDVVWAQESACHAPDKAPLVEEAARVLRKGGRIVLAEYVRAPGPESERIRDWCECWEMTLDTAEGWNRQLEAAGFVDVEVGDITPRMRRSLRRLSRLCRLLRPIAAVLHRVGLRSDAQQRNLRGGLVQWEALERGDWTYCLITARLPERI